MSTPISWEPPAVASHDEVLRLSEEVISLADIPIVVREDIFRVFALEMEWDIGVVVYEPADRRQIPIGPDGKKAGVFLLQTVRCFERLERLERTH